MKEKESRRKVEGGKEFAVEVEPLGVESANTNRAGTGKNLVQVRCFPK
jgi:hypothetical protein